MSFIFNFRIICSCLQVYLFLRSSYINKFFGDRLPFTKICGVVIHLQKFWGCLPFTLFWGRLPITNFFEVVFHFQVEVRSDRLPFSKICEVVFHLQKILRSSSIYIFLRSSFNYKFFEVVFQLQIFLSSSSIFKLRWGRLPFWSYLLLYLPNIVILILRRMVGRPAGWMAGRPG